MATTKISNDLDPPDDGRVIIEEEPATIKLLLEEKIMQDIEKNTIQLIGDAVVIDHCPMKCNGNGVC